MRYILSLFGKQKSSLTISDLKTLLDAMDLTLTQLVQAANAKAEKLTASAATLRSEQAELQKQANAKGQEAGEKENISQALKDAASKIS